MRIEKIHLVDLGVHVRIILKWILRKKWLHLYYIYLAEGTDHWSVLVNTVMKLRLP